MTANKGLGFTLIELMIAMTLGIIVTGGALSIYISSIRSSADIAKSARLNYDLDTTMQLMVNDIRRAGYWGGAVISGTGTFLLDNPFNSDTSTLNIRTLAAPTTDPTPNAGDCILYSYDVDDGDNNTIPETPNGLINTNEYYGFKLDRDAIWIRYSGTNTTSCSDGNWERITDEETIKITHLQFSFLPIAAQSAVANVHPALPALTATSRCLNDSYTAADAEYITNALSCGTVATGDNIAQRRVVNIHLSGYVIDDVTLKSLSTSVQIRNDRLYVAP